MIFKLIKHKLKLSSFLIVIILCIGFLSCATASFSVPNVVTVPEDFFGISPDRSPLNVEDYQLLTELNASWIRTTIFWRNVEPNQGEWTFDRWDNYLEKAEAAGKKVVFIFAYDNKWLFEDNKEHRKINADQLPFFLNYVEQVVRRYGTRAVYEIWNEPNFVFWKGSTKDFYKLAIATAKRIYETNPDVTILAGSTFMVDKSFTRGLFKSGAMEHVDGFSVHPYALTPIKTIKGCNKLKNVLDDFKFPGLIWVTEVGYFSGPRPLFSTKKYPEYIVKTLSGLAVRADHIRVMVWYELMNDYNKGEEETPLSPIHYLGLIYPNGTFKPGAETFMLTANYLAKSEYNPDLPIREKVNKKITSLYFSKEDGTNILLLWNDGLGKKELRLSVSGAEVLSRHNIHNREVTSLPNDAVLQVSKEPVFITWKGGEAPRLTN